LSSIDLLMFNSRSSYRGTVFGK